MKKREWKRFLARVTDGYFSDDEAAIFQIAIGGLIVEIIGVTSIWAYKAFLIGQHVSNNLM